MFTREINPFPPLYQVNEEENGFEKKIYIKLGKLDCRGKEYIQS